MGANSRLSATCSVTSARSPEPRQSLTARDVVLNSHGLRPATVISRTTSVPRPAATRRSNKSSEGFKSSNPLPTHEYDDHDTFLPFHGLPLFETGFSPLGFADRPAHASRVASKHISGRLRHWQISPPKERHSRHVNHRPSRESSTHAAEKYELFRTTHMPINS
jgi:hypothetical protein